MIPCPNLVWAVLPSHRCAGLLTNKYLNGVPEDSRAALEGSFQPGMLSDENLDRVRALNEIAKRRGQTLAQMAIAWVLRRPEITSALIGARHVQQLDNSLDALNNLEFSADELAEIDKYATDGGLNLWQKSSDSQAES